MTWGAALAKTWGLPAAPTLLRLPRATDVFWGAGAALRLRFVGVASSASPRRLWSQRTSCESGSLLGLSAVHQTSEPVQKPLIPTRSTRDDVASRESHLIISGEGKRRAAACITAAGSLQLSITAFIAHQSLHQK